MSLYHGISWDRFPSVAADTSIYLLSQIFSVTTDSETLANVLVKEVMYLYGVPRYIHSDQGANLCIDVIKSLSSLLGFKLSHTSAYHPQGNGQVGRFNKTLEAMLSNVVKEHQHAYDWDTHIPL